MLPLSGNVTYLYGTDIFFFRHNGGNGHVMLFDRHAIYELKTVCHGPDDIPAEVLRKAIVKSRPPTEAMTLPVKGKP